MPLVFGNLLFLILALLVLSTPPELGSELLTSGEALVAGLLLYLLVLEVILLQNFASWRLRGRAPGPGFWILTNLELLLFLLLYHLLLNAERLYAVSMALVNGIGLLFYFGGLFLHSWSARSPMGEVRFLIPFALPFLLLNLLYDLVPGVWILFLFLLVLFLFFPYLLKALWGCRPLQRGAVRGRLESLCKRVGFRYAEMLTWPVMRHVRTAAIIGILPRFRYILFTEGLLRLLKPAELEAVLAHEMGHAYHRHLLLYPLVLAGLVVLVTYVELLGLGVWLTLLLDLLVVVIYFRLVFGLFSRNFERQADLFVFIAEVPAMHLIHAFERIAGRQRHHPSWHHYSIQQRIDFLKLAMSHPKVIAYHHRRVRLLLAAYSALFVAALLGIVYALL